MENPTLTDARQTDRVENRTEDLHLDRVVASQPEIGPTPPDGGYGWLIVVSAVIYHITVPAVLTLYGLIILKAIREEGHEKEELLKIWDVDIALVPVIMVVIRLLLESWCRAIVKIFNMPRFMALAGLCLTVAGILLSSYSTDATTNDHIVNIFSGIFAGIGCALTGQQTEVIITHFFREKLTMAQRIVRMAPSVGNCLIPILVGYLCTVYTGDIVVMIYGAIVMQNCLFLASYTRPIYIEKVIRHTYNMLREAVEDEDEVIFSNQARVSNERQQSRQTNNSSINNEPLPSNAQEDDGTDVVVFKSNKNAKEIIDPVIQHRENINQARFSSDFTSMVEGGNTNRFSSDFGNSNRFSSNFGSLEIGDYERVTGYQELASIENDSQNPQPLYRETTVEAVQNNLVFAVEMTPGTARRTASMKKNFITITNMLLDVNFYLYALLHLCTTFSIMILGVVFPPLIWEQNPNMNIWSVSTLIAAAHGSALCFIMLCVVLPKSINEKARLCAAFCVAGAVGFYGITLSNSKSLLVVWCMLASFSTAASSILEQPLYNSTLNDFDTTATMTASNTVVAIFIMIWSLSFNYEYKTCFLTASVLQTVTACMFFALSFRRRR
ncbi:uncharacterized protein LOC114241008 isoform X2 [Bombyx mandarina]|uniref:Uncharacterized protein LOC114241008 isoform X1 n=1 Tax=Bombyx mandarina TaxID=7092 RepID=A0A6J2JDE3_BOMMA|nr:uncharacterized protein LOC114241008 isoform X1 [Bombyx mandarina]XP_028027502.1 uncharacterized protein LOC114241008 isoform X2 [Bombyx mandarina]